MIRFFRMLEDVFAAAAFAEEGEWETARSLAGMKRTAKRQDKTTRPRPRLSV